MRLTYLYHSGFMLETDTVCLVFDMFLDGAAADPLNPRRGVYPRLSGKSPEHLELLLREDSNYLRPQNVTENYAGAVAVMLDQLIAQNKQCFFLASHFHQDHFQPCIVDIYKHYQALCKQQGKASLVHLVLSRDIARYRRNWIKDCKEQIFWVCKGKQLQFPKVQIEAFGSTDIGVSFVCHVDSQVIFHAGDLNNWHWSDCSTSEEISEAQKKFTYELSCILRQHQHFDVAMFPCDHRMGTGYLQGAQEFVQSFDVKYFVPMHNWEQYENTAKDLEILSKQHPNLKIWLPEHSGESLFI